MIDYEKLKITHELADKLTKNTGTRADVYVSCFYMDMPIYGLRFNISQDTMPYESMLIDELIAKLQELTKPKSKYEVGQEVWRVNDQIPFKCKISHVDMNSEEQYLDEYSWWKESELYPTREALIDAQVTYWIGMRLGVTDVTDEQLVNFMNKAPFRIEECQHEPEGPTSYLSMPPRYKCKKCGEFY